MSEPRPASVSVIIPTVLRPELTRALNSVKDQDYEGSIQVIVVVDLPESDEAQRVLVGLDESIVVLWTGGARGGGFARNLGINRASGDFIAFLDDDDEWLRTKLARQIKQIVVSRKERVLISSRVVQVDPVTEKSSIPVPTSLIGRDDRVENYLFLRRRASIGRASLYTSTLLMSTTLAREVPWDDALARHQDWDWLMQLQARSALRIVQLPSVEVRIWINSEGSISGGTNWKASLDWIRVWRSQVHRATYVDFVTAQSLRYALQARSPRGIETCVRELVSCRRPPNLGPSIIGLAGLVPRNLLSRLLLRQPPRSANPG